MEPASCAAHSLVFMLSTLAGTDEAYAPLDDHRWSARESIVSMPRRTRRTIHAAPRRIEHTGATPLRSGVSWRLRRSTKHHSRWNAAAARRRVALGFDPDECAPYRNAFRPADRASQSLREAVPSPEMWLEMPPASASPRDDQYVQPGRDVHQLTHEPPRVLGDPERRRTLSIVCFDPPRRAEPGKLLGSGDLG